MPDCKISECLPHTIQTLLTLVSRKPLIGCTIDEAQLEGQDGPVTSSAVGAFPPADVGAISCIAVHGLAFRRTGSGAQPSTVGGASESSTGPCCSGSSAKIGFCLPTNGHACVMADSSG